MDEDTGFKSRRSLGFTDLLHELTLTIEFFSEVMTNRQMNIIERFEAAKQQLDAVEAYRRLLHSTDIAQELAQLGRLIAADRPLLRDEL